jgi:hypothetical protein
MEELLLKQVYLHAFVAYCYENGKTGPGDLITPLVKKVIATFDKKTFTSKEVHEEIKKSFSKDFPLILIEREIQKLLSMKIIERNIVDDSKNEYTLIQDLSEIIEHFMLSQNKTNHFLSEFKYFLQAKNSTFGDLKLSALLKRLETFCIDNMVPILNYFGKLEAVIKREKTGKDIDLLIEEFFNECVNNNKELISEFENIFNGINLLYLFESCSEEIANSDYSIKEKCFYLDTNILLRILGLQNDYLNRLGKELYTFLIKNSFKVKVFRITLDELFSLIRGYDKASRYLIKGRNISHVYQTLKNKDYEPFQIDDIIEEILEKLDELNIEIDNTTKWLPVDYKEFENNIENLAKQKFEKRNDDDELKFDIYDENMQKYLYQAKHDMRCIELIRSLRENITQNRFEDEKYFFVTAESLLLQFNKNIYEKTRIKETIGDFALCFLLYFHDPKNVKGIALNSFIAANYNNTNLSVINWIKYVQIIHEKYNKGEINISQMGFLFTKTILNNSRFETEDLGDIISESLSEYVEMITQYESLRIEKEKTEIENEELKKENEDNISEILKKSEEAGKLFEKIYVLENNQLNLKSELSELHKQMRFIRRLIFITFAIIIGIAIGVFFYNKIIGSILFVFGVLFEIINIIDKSKKFLIKD